MSTILGDRINRIWKQQNIGGYGNRLNKKSQYIDLGE